MNPSPFWISVEFKICICALSPNHSFTALALLNYVVVHRRLDWAGLASLCSLWVQRHRRVPAAALAPLAQGCDTRRPPPPKARMELALPSHRRWWGFVPLLLLCLRCWLSERSNLVLVVGKMLGVSCIRNCSFFLFFSFDPHIDVHMNAFVLIFPSFFLF